MLQHSRNTVAREVDDTLIGLLSVGGCDRDTKRPSPTNSRNPFAGSCPSHLAVARMVCSLVHSTTMSFTGPER